MDRASGKLLRATLVVAASACPSIQRLTHLDIGSQGTAVPPPVDLWSLH